MNPRRIIRKGLGKTVGAAKKALSRNQRIKGLARNLIMEHLELGNPVPFDAYAAWADRHYPDAIDLQQQRDELAAMKYQPMISILTPTYNTNLAFLDECIESVRAQSYQNWELCIVDDASPNAEVREVIKEWAKKDSRIKYHFRKKNGHISRASNDALELATGEFIGLLDHDDVLWPNALYEVVKVLNQDKKIDFFYSDEELIMKDRRDHRPHFFKPDWNPEFMESVNMITHFSVTRASLMHKIGGFRVGFEGAQDWDLFLRMAQHTNKIHHIPTMLYSWRMSETSTALTMDSKPYVREAQKRALEESLKARGLKAEVQQGVLRDYWNVVYPVVGNPKISIVIPSVNMYHILKRAVDSIYAKTTYQNFEIIIVDTGSTEKNVRKWYAKIEAAHDNLTVLEWPEKPFSYARSCNFGASKATGEYLVMLNNDTEVITPEWLELMLSDAQRDGIGAVGVKLYYPDGIHIQHAAIGVGLGDFAANLLSTVHSKQRTGMQHIYGDTRHEVTAVTAACLMIKKDRYDEIGGFDEKFRVTYNDVDLCLRLRKAGYRNIYSPIVELLHHESISVGRPEEKKVRDTAEFDAAKRLFKKRWQDVIANDPNLNPNIERTNANFEVSSK